MNVMIEMQLVIHLVKNINLFVQNVKKCMLKNQANQNYHIITSNKVGGFMTDYDKQYLKYQMWYGKIKFKPIRHFLVILGVINRRKKKKHG